MKGAGDLLLPYDPWLGPTLLAVVGVVVVLVLVLVERRLWARRPPVPEHARD
jgi:putative membrane protein